MGMESVRQEARYEFLHVSVLQVNQVAGTIEREMILGEGPASPPIEDSRSKRIGSYSCNWQAALPPPALSNDNNFLHERMSLSSTDMPRERRQTSCRQRRESHPSCMLLISSAHEAEQDPTM